VDVTDEMRHAVYLADCERVGHQPNFLDATTVKYDDKGVVTQRIEAKDEFKFPHVKCARCGGAWIVFPVMGLDYEDAERKVYDHLNPDHDMARRIVSDRAQRAEAKNSKEKK
jgi:hypothetical protein